MRRGILGSLVAVGLGLAMTGSALANGDPAAGKWKFDTCLGCHGVAGYTNAYPDFNVPKLGGQHYTYIVATLKEFQSGARKHPTMTAQAKSLSNQDIEDIAAYLSQLGNGKGEPKAKSGSSNGSGNSGSSSGSGK